MSSSVTSFQFPLGSPFCSIRKRTASCTALGRHQIYNILLRGKNQIRLSQSLLVIKEQRCPAGLCFLLLVFSICFISSTTQTHAPWLKAEQLVMSRLVELASGEKTFSTVDFYGNTAPLMSDWKKSGGCIRSYDCSQ